MSFVLLGIVAAIAVFGLYWILMSIRAALFSRGFASTSDMLLILFYIGVSVALVAWLGPIALVGVGL